MSEESMEVDNLVHVVHGEDETLAFSVEDVTPDFIQAIINLLIIIIINFLLLSIYLFSIVINLFSIILIKFI